MTLRSALSRAGFALLLLASLAMSATAFAHRTSQGMQTPEVLAYLSMGGTLDELCGDAGLTHHLTAACEACRISANALAPQDTPDAAVPMAFATSAHETASGARPIQRHTAVTPPSRAPPFA